MKTTCTLTFTGGEVLTARIETEYPMDAAKPTLEGPVDRLPPGIESISSPTLICAFQNLARESGAKLETALDGVWPDCDDMEDLDGEEN